MTSPEPRLLAGRTALVTGSSRSMGAAIARTLGRHGAAVAVNYRRDEAAAQEVATTIRAGGSRAVVVAGDATDPSGIATLVASTTAELGDVDLLVVNSIGDTGDLVERLLAGASTLDDAEAVVDRTRTQLSAALFACRAVVPGMRRRGGGSIVLIGASGTRDSGGRGSAEIIVAKAAQDALCRLLAAELGPDGIRVNVVAPGFVPTDANAGPRQQTIADSVAERAPLRRVATVDDVADAVLVASSDLSRTTTGAFVPVDGGVTMP